MLASFPASMLNQNTPDLGILNRLKLDPSRSRLAPIANGATFPDSNPVQGHRADTGRASGPELLAQDAFLEAVTGVEQHPHRDRLVGQHLDAADVAHVVMVGGGRDRTLLALEHFDD